MKNATKSSSTFKPKGSIQARNTLVVLAESDSALGIKALPVTLTTVHKLISEGLVKESGIVKTGGRGRPSKLYALTPKGKKRAQRAIGRRDAQAQAVTETLSVPQQVSAACERALVKLDTAIAA